MSREHCAQSHPGSPGLTSVEATHRLTEYGPNEPAPTRRLSAVVEIGRLFANPLVLILLVASVVSGWLGEDVDAANKRSPEDQVSFTWGESNSCCS
jgi:magnesium-transporting ATPase (P-type)